DTEALAAAFEGAAGVFALVPPVFDRAPGFPEASGLTGSLRAALARGKPEKAVALSTIGANAPRRRQAGCRRACGQLGLSLPAVQCEGQHRYLPRQDVPVDPPASDRPRPESAPPESRAALAPTATDRAATERSHATGRTRLPSASSGRVPSRRPPPKSASPVRSRVDRTRSARDGASSSRQAWYRGPLRVP